MAKADCALCTSACDGHQRSQLICWISARDEETARRRIYGGRSGEHEVSIASAAAVIKHLDRTALRADGDPDRAGRAMGAGRPAADGARGRRGDRAGAADVGAHGAARPRGVPGAHPSEDTLLTIESRRQAGERGRSSDRPRTRRRLPGAARPVWRRRHGAGPARARQRAVRRRRRAGVGGRAWTRPS